MYEILVIDDEEVICRGIKSKIERSGIPNLGEIMLSFNAVEARERIRSTKPNIVITDICMPKINGLDLIKYALTESNKTRFIVLSGYEEFQYAKTALKLGVVDYILKPANIHVIKEALEAAIRSLKSDELDSVSQDNRKNLLLEKCFNNFYMNSEEQVTRVKEAFKGIEINADLPFYYVSIFNFPENGISEEFKDGVLREFISAANTYKSSDIGIVYQYYNLKNDLIIIINTSDIHNYKKILKMVADLALGVKGNSNYKCFISISEKAEGLENLYVAYRQAEKALTYKIMSETWCVIEYMVCMVKMNEYETFIFSMEELSKNFNDFRIDKINNFIDGHFNHDKLKKYSMEVITRLYQDFIHVVTDFLHCNHIVGLIEFDVDIRTFESLRDLRIYLKDNIYKLSKDYGEINNNCSIIDKVKQYVRENINKDISMSMVANMVNMNYSYFSKLFKDKSGMNFSEYLTFVKMDEAKKYLVYTMLKINQISSKLGYDSPQNFAKAFKNYYGISPKDYRMKKAIDIIK